MGNSLKSFTDASSKKTTYDFRTYLTEKFHEDVVIINVVFMQY